MKENLDWCFKKDRGIRLIEPNKNVAEVYLEDAKRDLGLIDKNEPKWNIIKEYYVCYNALYSLLMKTGIKCEIHNCTIVNLSKRFRANQPGPRILMPYFDFEEDLYNKMIDLKKERINVQYYLGDSKKDYLDFTREFMDACETKFLELNDSQINKIRNKPQTSERASYQRYSTYFA